MKVAAAIVCLGLATLFAPTCPAARAAALLGQTESPSPSEIDASRAVVGGADVDRLMRDRAYAGEILQHLARLEPAMDDDPRALAAIASLRMVALVTLDRRDEIRAGIDRMLARQSSNGDEYAAPFGAALVLSDWERLVGVIETASRNVPGVGWAELRAFLDREMVWTVFGQLATAHDEARRVRLADALFRIGWPGDGDAEGADALRLIMLDDRLDRGDRAAASELASGISTPTSLLPMIVQKRYDAVLAPGADRLSLLRRALEERDRATAEAVGGSSQDVRRLLDRVQYLRGVGRDADALALLEPFTQDVRATVAGNEFGMWLINEAGYALMALGRNDEAVALMGRLVELPIAENAGLIGPSINYSIMLWQTGRHSEALEHATMLERESSQFANDYGRMWIASSIACSLVDLNRRTEAAPQLERLRAQADANPAALTRAYLCLGDEDAAAASIIRRLESDDPESAIIALQDFTLSKGDGQTGRLNNRLAALRDRPAVRTALERVGRVLSLPLARTYWGDF